MKNKKICIFSLVFILGLTIVLIQERNTPEDNDLSSGDSVIWGNMDKIDNYSNIKKYLKYKKFSFLDHIMIFQEEDEYPQGLCFTEDLVFISLYSGKRGSLGKIKIYEKESGEYLLSLGMDENSHLGGVTYDGTYIWVCNSSKMAIEKISYSLILQMIQEHRGQMIDARNLVSIHRVNNIPSCVTYYDGQLWVATHSIFLNSVMTGYYYDTEKKELCSQESFWIPPKVQGVAFTEKGEVILSTSYGRKNSSYIKKYNSIYMMSKDVKSYIEKIKLPPCSEEIFYEQKKLYVLFESAGKKYRDGTDGKGKSTAPIDKILVLEQN